MPSTQPRSCAVIGAGVLGASGISAWADLAPYRPTRFQAKPGAE